MSPLLQPAYPRPRAAEVAARLRAWRPQRDRVPADGAVREVVAVPAERLVLLAVDLPAAGARQRREALPFAVEEVIADPLEAVHVAMGAELEDGRVLAAVVRHAVMAEWIAGLDAAGRAGASLVPDCLLLPRPAAGWAVRVEGARALVRTAHGTGFAVAVDQLASAWIAGGRPAVAADAATLPEGVPAAAPAALPDRAAAPPIDLRQGRYAVRRRRPAASLVRRVAIVAALGIGAHAAIAAADTLLLTRIAAQEEAATRTLAAATMPLAPDADVVAAAGERLAGIAPPAVPDRLLPLLGRVAQALRPVGAIPMQAIRYDAAGGRLAIVADPADAPRIAAALAATGLGATAAGGTVTVPGA